LRVTHFAVVEKSISKSGFELWWKNEGRKERKCQKNKKSPSQVTVERAKNRKVESSTQRKIAGSENKVPARHRRRRRHSPRPGPGTGLSSSSSCMRVPSPSRTATSSDQHTCDRHGRSARTSPARALEARRRAASTRGTRQEERKKKEDSQGKKERRPERKRKNRVACQVDGYKGGRKAPTLSRNETDACAYAPPPEARK
jgi:hypothetical protein